MRKMPEASGVQSSSQPNVDDACCGAGAAATGAAAGGRALLTKAANCVHAGAGDALPASRGQIQHLSRS